MTLYELLGVRRNASAKTIQKAYRSKAMSSHPDRGGSAEEFEKIKHAYDVLSNTKRRKRYDETGDHDSMPEHKLRSSAIQEVHKAYFQSIEYIVTAFKDPEQEDLVKEMLHRIQIPINNIEQDLAKVSKLIKVFEKVLGRFKVKDESSENTLETLTQLQINEAKAKRKHIEDTLEIFNLAKQIINDYTYEHKKKKDSGSSTTNSMWFVLNHNS